MRTSRLTCIAVFVTLLGATTCLADTFTNAYATYSNPYEYDTDGFAFDRWAWTPGTYNWSFSITADASAAIRGTDGTGSSAEGYASAFVVVAGGGGGSATAYAPWAGEPGGYEDDDAYSNSGSVYMDEEGQVLYCSESSSATATCGGPLAYAHARGQTSASASIWQ
jgi:hypothetical protein